ncbi:MAG: cobalamin-dependent protein, partial [Candidatus Coatesbacteria bacterium]|nr:cobalamin-dependent protein [Candidatus Coatesbacteria bacterium]
MRVFLGNSPWYKEGFYGVRAGSRWPHFQPNSSKYMPFPFFLAYSAAVLERLDNVDVLLIDGVAEKMTVDEFHRRMREFHPDVVVLEVSTISIDVDLACAKKVRIDCPEAKIIFCGIHTVMFEPEFLECHDYVDFVMKGEYEYTLRDLVLSLQSGHSPAGVSGILYRSNGQASFTGDRS